MRAPTFVGLVVAAALCAGCTSRPTHRIDASRAAPRRDGWVNLGRDVRLRDDTPPLADVLPPPASSPSYGALVAGDPAYGDFGPRGSTGESSTFVGSEPTSYGYGYGFGYGYGTPTFGAPGGAVPPGLREPSDTRASSPFAAPYRAAFPGADVTSHRPGLSTGSGVFGRQDDGPPPTPAPLPAPTPRR